MTSTLTRFADADWVPRFLAGAKVLYTDLDGTLLGRGGSLLTDADGKPDATAAVAAAMVNAAALPVVMVSGRNVKQLLELARLMGWRDYIAEVGCVRVRDRGLEVRYELGDWVPEAACTSSYAAAEGGVTPYALIEHSGVVRALLEAFPGKLEYHTPYETGRLVTHALRGQVEAAEAQAVLDGFELPLALVDNGIIHPLRHTLTGVSRVHAYHVMPKGVTKVHAIEADLVERGCSSAEAMAIGDSVTDLAMAPAVGLMVLVRNALEHPDIAKTASGTANVVVTDGSAGHGWSELARSWVSAREGAVCGRG